MQPTDAHPPERSHEDFTGSRAVAKMRELVKKSPTCFFCSAMERGRSFETRPMSVQKVDDDGTLWFLSARDSHLNKELAADPAAQLLFQGTAHTDFLSLFGRAAIGFEGKIKELWEPILKTWFPGGVDDPRISVIRVSPETGYYWDTKHGRAVTLAKMLVGAATGKTLDDSVQGRLMPHS
jgi:general stress protein 26